MFIIYKKNTMGEMWLARDKDCTLIMYEREPLKDKLAEKWTLGGKWVSLPKNWFTEVQWEDEEPMKVFLVTEEDYKFLQKKKEEARFEYLNSLTPIEREIIDGKNKLELFKCVDKVKRYNFSNHKESTEFLTINEFLEQDFYTDDGDYEAYLSDGEYFIGVDLHWLGIDECKEFIDKNKHLFGENKTLCIYFVDYPEDK